MKMKLDRGQESFRGPNAFEDLIEWINKAIPRYYIDIGSGEVRLELDPSNLLSPRDEPRNSVSVHFYFSEISFHKGHIRIIASKKNSVYIYNKNIDHIEVRGWYKTWGVSKKNPHNLDISIITTDGGIYRIDFNLRNFANMQDHYPGLSWVPMEASDE